MDVGKRPGGSSEHGAGWSPAAVTGDGREASVSPAGGDRQEAKCRRDADLRCTVYAGTIPGGERLNGPDASKTDLGGREADGCAAGSLVEHRGANR